MWLIFVVKEGRSLEVVCLLCFDDYYVDDYDMMSIFFFWFLKIY